MTEAATHAPTTSRVPTDLGTLVVHDHPSPDPDAPVALLWHSLFATSASWAPTVPLLRGRRRLVVVDGPGHGQSDPLRRRTTIAGSAAVAAQVLDRLGLASVDWVGNAWGGHTGLHLAATAPDRVRSLVAISSPVQPVTRAQRRQVRVLDAVVRTLGPVRPVRDAVARIQLAQPDGPHRPALDAALRAPSRRSLSLAVRSFVADRTDLSWALSRVRVPTLLVATDDRFDWTPELAAEAAAQLPDGQVVTVRGANVLAPLEQPAATAEVVLAHWDRVDAARQQGGPGPAQR